MLGLGYTNNNAVVQAAPVTGREKEHGRRESGRRGCTVTPTDGLSLLSSSGIDVARKRIVFSIFIGAPRGRAEAQSSEWVGGLRNLKKDRLAFVCP